MHSMTLIHVLPVVEAPNFRFEINGLAFLLITGAAVVFFAFESALI